MIAKVRVKFKKNCGLLVFFFQSGGRSALSRSIRRSFSFCAAAKSTADQAGMNAFFLECAFNFFGFFFGQFLGSTDVDQPKGIDVVKEGIRKLRFSQQLRKAEGQRTPKVELTVSVDGVAIQEPKVKVGTSSSSSSSTS